MQSFPTPRLVLVIDNVLTYYLPLIKKLYAKVGIVIKFLLPYSPNLSPIKELFSALKS